MVFYLHLHAFFYVGYKVPQSVSIPAGCVSIKKAFIHIATVLIVIVVIIDYVLANVKEGCHRHSSALQG